MFGLATLLLLLFCVAYFTVEPDQTFLGWSALNFALGASLGGALLLIGSGIIRWAKQLMGDHEIVEMRHPAARPTRTAPSVMADINAGLDESGIGRRPLIRNSLLGAVGALGLAPRSSCCATSARSPRSRNTVWRKGMRVVNDVSGAPIKPADLEVGQLVNAEPEALFEEDEHGERVIHGTEALQAKSKAAVIVVRMRPEDIRRPRAARTGASTASSATPRSAPTSAARSACGSSRRTTCCARATSRRSTSPTAARSSSAPRPARFPSSRSA